MKKVIYSILCSILLLNASCTDFMDDIKPMSSVTDEGIWLTESSAMLFMSKVYRDLDGPYYSVNGLNDHAVDILFTDDCIQIGEKASNQWNLFDSISIGCMYGLVILLIHFIVALYVKEKQTQQSNNKLSCIKLNASVFRTLLNEQPQYDIDKNIGILLGNTDAKEWITIISNPHCAPCARLHPQIEELLKEYKEEICIQIVLTSFSKELEPSAMLLTSMYLLNKESDYLRFLSDWYTKERHKREGCYKRYKLNLNDKEMLANIQAQNEWVKRNTISSTPTILINGYLLPEEYELKDMSYLIN